MISFVWWINLYNTELLIIGLTEKTMTEKNENYDIFTLNKIYPDARDIFIAKYKSLIEIKDECIVVVDTNALLVPFTINQKSLSRVKETYSNLVKEERLVIPGQVAREFAKNRTKKISELFDSLSKKRDHNLRINTGKYPLLASLDNYNEALKLEKEINDLLKKYSKTLGKVLEHVQEWNWDDRVSELYGEILKECVMDIEINKETIEDFKVRLKHKIPPGYKDASKPDNGIGDYLIWKTILEVGHNEKRSVLLVSGDNKPDWHHKSNKTPLYPRYELMDEFRRVSDGETFSIVRFSRFLDLFGADDEVVNEVKSKEVRLVSSQFNYYGGDFIYDSRIQKFAKTYKEQIKTDISECFYEIELVANDFELSAEFSNFEVFDVSLLDAKVVTADESHILLDIKAEVIFSADVSHRDYDTAIYDKEDDKHYFGENAEYNFETSATIEGSMEYRFYNGIPLNFTDFYLSHYRFSPEIIKIDIDEIREN